MSDVKWIKITTDMFDDEKIQLIDAMPAGDSIIGIWVRLICLAGKVNDCGKIYLTERLPYTDVGLQAIFRKPLTTVQLALNTLEEFGMVITVNGVITIANWFKYQNKDGLAKIRENGKARTAKWRKGLEDKSKKGIDIESDVTVTSQKSTKVYFSELVKMRQDQYDKLLADFGEYGGKNLVSKFIERLDNYMGSKNKKYSDHYRTVRSWIQRDIDEGKLKKKATTKSKRCPKCDGAVIRGKCARCGRVAA
jgi:predicted phage replisome organizer